MISSSITQDDIITKFRSFDTSGEGTIHVSDLGYILRHADETWSSERLHRLLQAMGAADACNALTDSSSAVSYEKLVDWAFGLPAATALNAELPELPERPPIFKTLSTVSRRKTRLCTNPFQRTIDGTSSDSEDLSCIEADETEFLDETQHSTSSCHRRRAVCGTKYGAWNRRVLTGWEATFVEKTPEQDNILRRAFAEQIFCSAAIERGDADSLVNAATIVYPLSGDVVVQQGEFGEAFFVVLAGALDCSITSATNTNQQVERLLVGDFFGAEVLLWHSRWPFSMRAVGDDVVLASLDRTDFQNIVVIAGEKERERRIDCLHRCELLELFNDEQIAKLVDVLTLKIYRAGDVIVKEGERGRHFFVIESGECSVDKGGDTVGTLKSGSLFGERALLEEDNKRKATVTATSTVEALRLSRTRFERLFGPMTMLRQEHFNADPRKLIADFYSSSSSRLFKTVEGSSSCVVADSSPSWFAVFRPTSRDAISKLISGEGVGKGLNVKGKSAKKGILSGFVPFLQIADNGHKSMIEASPADSRVDLFFKSEHARRGGYQILQNTLSDNPSTLGIDVPEIYLIDAYAPKSYGLDIPERLLREAYIDRQDLEPPFGWVTGRKSEPAFMDMNLHAIRDKRHRPKVVLFQFDEGNPLNPHGLLIAYAENFVRPVVSDFDTFLVGSKGIEYEPLPFEQQAIATWSLDRTSEILHDQKSGSWTDRWLSVLQELAESGVYHDMPEFGFGDPSSTRLVEEVVRSTRQCGAVRHGAECFNFHFPQELDDEFLVIWEDLGGHGQPWCYKTEPELRDFLVSRAREGFTFPLNPVWPVRDAGWYDVLAALRDSRAAQQSMNSWFPPESGILSRIDAIHLEHPEGFASCAPLDQTNLRELADLVLYKEARAFECRKGILRKKVNSVLLFRGSLVSSSKSAEKLQNGAKEMLTG